MASDRRTLAIQLLKGAATALADRVEEVNRLNVFPVPDGDTGTNMSLTMDAVLADVERLPPEASRSEICSAVARGSLMGARGNSGVILSQMLRGLCESLGAAETLDAPAIAGALVRSQTVAFQAVRKPVEGTMLTVLKDSARAARSAATSGATLDELLDSVVTEAFASVRRTPELLPVLKENGVVDAGGFGVAILAEGLVAAFEGHEVRDFDISTAPPILTAAPEDDWDDDEYLYCTEFLLHGFEADLSVLQQFISDQGGSELVVGDAEAYKIHVHTDDPATVLGWATNLGEVSDVHINNMRRQTEQRAAAIRSESAERKPIGLVAVAAGSGLGAILTSLGVDEVVNGGQTMNPSTAELLDAVKRVPADEVIILPNNKNIQLAAQQAAELADRPVFVVPTTSVPEAFAALLAFDAEESPAERVATMSEAASAVRTGEITTAIKDSKAKVGPIRKGQVIGIIDHEIEVVGEDVSSVARRLSDLLATNAETLTVLAGADFDDDALDALVAILTEAHPDVEIESHRGEQPLYPLIIAAE